MANENTALQKLMEQVPTQQADKKSFLEVAQTGSYLPRFQLLNPTAELVTTGGGKAGNYVIVNDGSIAHDLTNDCTVLPVAWRAKAFQNTDPVLLSYDKDSELFKKIMAESEIQDSQAMYGPDWLLWVPEAKAFAEFFMCSASLRRSSRKLFEIFANKKPVKLRSELVGKRTKWFVPVIDVCTTPFANLPTPEDLKKEVEKFLNPETPEAPEAAPKSTRAR